MSQHKDLKTVMILYPDLEIKSDKDYDHLINIHNLLTRINSYADPEMVKIAFDNRLDMKLENNNDYFYLIFKAMRSSVEFKKFAYPMMFGEDEIKGEFDLDKWAGLVHKIYDAVSTRGVSIDHAIDYYADTLDKESSEDISFKRWISYYKDGEHLKYSESEPNIKEAFQFPLSGGGFYPSEFKPPQTENRLPFESARNEVNSKQEYLEWKNKLYSAIRRLDKLLRQSDTFLDSAVHRDLADLLHNFDQEVRSLRHEVTASDIAVKFANKFKKKGFEEGYDVLTKYAQEIAPDFEASKPKIPDMESEPKSDLELPSLGGEASPDAIGINPSTEQPKGDGKTSVERVFSESEQTGDEYSDLSGVISLEQAASKLEEVAGLLADRRVVRHLAEFDIMLDKIGIASMFPELAEAQSKLIDAYSYALTRVTKMLGMVSSGRSLSQISDAKQTELVGKTMKEVNKTFEGDPEADAENKSERGTPAIQKGIEEQAKVEEPIKQGPPPTEFPA